MCRGWIVAILGKGWETWSSEAGGNEEDLRDGSWMQWRSPFKQEESSSRTKFRDGQPCAANSRRWGGGGWVSGRKRRAQRHKDKTQTTDRSSWHAAVKGGGRSAQRMMGNSQQPEPIVAIKGRFGVTWYSPAYRNRLTQLEIKKQNPQLCPTISG